jgi:glycosyltransferase involved in cell wall biosynthesis
MTRQGGETSAETLATVQDADPGGAQATEEAHTAPQQVRDALARRYPRVAISHEWLTIPGGSEKVVAAILQLLPHAELFTAVYDPAPWPALITDRPVHASWLNHIPGATRRYARLLPLMDGAFRRFDLSAFDLVISSNHACAKNVRTSATTPHVCYCHTPMRYVWDPTFLANEQIGPLGRLAFTALLPHLRRTDLRGAAGVDRFIANSSVVAQRIADHYGRSADIIHPPVEVDRFIGRPRAAIDTHAASATGRSTNVDERPYLVFGRVVPYKRVDVAVRACERLSRRVIVAGDGRALEDVQALSGPTARFLGRIPDADVGELMARCRALLLPGEEDFGIVPVEAQAAGLPVIANARGGVRDSVIDGSTGVLYDDPSVDGLCAAIQRFETLALSEAAIRANALRFAPRHFAEAFAAALLQ